EGGDAGGRIVAQGTPEEVMRVKESYTGQSLREVLKSSGVKKSRPASRGRNGAGPKAAKAKGSSGKSSRSRPAARQGSALE
ncbi:MAG: hypothetical protein ACOC0J_02565, partial [Myxococcota bacterium]